MFGFTLNDIFNLVSLVLGGLLDMVVFWLTITGWSLPFVMAIAGISMRNTGIEYKLAVLVLLGIGVLNGYYGAVYFQLDLVRDLYLAVIPFAIFAAGPTIWLGLQAYTSPLFQINPVYIIHYIPGVIMSGLVSAYLFTSRLGIWPFEFRIVPSLVIFIGLVVGAIYALVSLVSFVKLYRADDEPGTATRIRHTFLITVAFFVVVLGITGSAVMVLHALSPLVPLIISTIAMLIAVVGYFRYPELFEILLEAIDAAPHRRTSMPDSLADEIARQLDFLMSEQKRFRDSDISLAGLAELIDITPHQLSEYLNHHVGSNFSRFINGYRVEEIKRILVDKPSRSIIEIAMDSGFNSKSAFNAAFSEIAGTTPSAWRKSQTALKKQQTESPA